MRASSLVIFLLVSCTLWGQTYTANIKRFGVEHGLSHHDGRSVALDSRGLIWLGTRNGLNRFDGKQFKSFYKEDGLANNNVESIFADGEVLLCVHKSRTTEAIEAITLFHSVTETTLSFSDWFGIEGINEDDVNVIYGNEEELVFRTDSDGVVRWFLKKEGQETVEFEMDVTFEFLASSQDGTYWFHEWENETITHRDSSGEVLKTFSTKHLSNFWGKFYVDMRFGEDEEWLYAYDSLYRIVGNKVKLVDSLWGVAQHQNKFVQLPSEFVRKHPHTGLLWYSSKSVSHVIDSSGRKYFSHEDKTQFVNNTDQFVGNVVLQPASSGLNIISLYPSKFQNFSDDSKTGYRGVARLGTDYLVCNEEGVFVLNKDFKAVKKWISYVGDNVSANNGITYTFGRSVINEIDQEQNLITRYIVPHAHEVWGMLAIDSFLLYSSYGFHQYNLNTRYDRLVKSKKHPELNEATIYSIQRKSEDEFWLCATTGLYTWNKQTDLFEKLFDNLDGVSEFQHLYDDGHSLWLASGGKGLVKYDKTSQESQFYDFGHNGTNITHSVYPDSHGNLWLSTDHGIVRFNIENEEHTLFLKTDGLIGNEFNRISHFKDDDGTLIFGGVKGLVRFHPDSLANLTVAKPVLRPFIADVWLYRKGRNEITQVTNEFNQNSTVTIEPQDRFLSFDLATNSIEYYDRVQFSYKIDDDETWKKLPSNRLAFNVLPFGSHQITVQTSLTSGYVYDEHLSFSITVLRPIYLRSWFIAAVLLAFASISLLFAVYRTRNLRKQKLFLEKEVRKRTQKIKEDKKVMERQAEELKSLDKMKNRFFANISHELRNPLTLIVGPVENLLNQASVKVPDMVRAQMSLTLANARTLQKRVNEILALSKIDSGKLKLTPSAAKLGAFVGRLVSVYDSFASSGDLFIQFESKIDAGLVVKIDMDHTEKIVNNLLSNAIKHSPIGSTISVQLTETEEGAYCLSVTDKGKGIDSAEQKKIFDRYYQSKEGEKAGGTGLGLALSDELSRLMGGEIIVDPTYTEGAKFLFTFKAQKTNEEPADHETESGIAQIPKSDFKQVDLQPSGQEANILVVDDNEEMRLYIKSILGAKCRIYEAENGIEGLKVVETRSIDLITSDLMMPEMDGMELLQELKSREACRTIPIIMLTARAEDKDKLNALEIGVDDYITKPFYARELLARVNNLLEKRFMRGQAAVEEVEASDTATDSEIQIQKIVEVIQQHLANNKFSVADLAEEVGYSERQLRRVIKKEKGVTSNALIKELRLNQARQYLEQQQFATVSEVMYACGLKSAGHFSKDYFNRFGKKPSEYFD